MLNEKEESAKMKVSEVGEKMGSRLNVELQVAECLVSKLQKTSKNVEKRRKTSKNTKNVENDEKRRKTTKTSTNYQKR
jgi:hypothetical protein